MAAASQATGDGDPKGPSPSFVHDPVMVDEVVELVAGTPSGVFLDATLGGGGHAERILSAHEHLALLGLDRDPTAIEAATRRLARFAGRVRVERARFDEIGEVLERTGTDEVSGFLFDLGVSSPQLDHADRGFSYRHDGPLDMRMDPDGPRTAADIVNTAEVSELADILRHYGDERFARRVADAIVAGRPFSRTTELAQVVVEAIPAAARRRGGHPAKRTFQALRIAVNEELDVLAPALEQALEALAAGGRGMALTYHSGEDRIVKDVFRRWSATPEVPADLPLPPDEAAAEADFAVVRPLARRPTEAERSANPRSSSARLRVIERTAARAA